MCTSISKTKRIVFCIRAWQLTLNGTVITGEGTYASSLVLQRRVEHLIAFEFAQQWFYDWHNGFVYALTTDQFPVCQKLQLSSTIMPLRWQCFLTDALYVGRKELPVISYNNNYNNKDFNENDNNQKNDNNNYHNNNADDNNNKIDEFSSPFERKNGEPILADFWQSPLAIIAVSTTDPNRIFLFHHLASNLVKLFHTFIDLDDDSGSLPHTIKPFLMPPFICTQTNISSQMPSSPCE